MKIALFVCFLQCVSAANILAFFNYPSYSHHKVFYPIVKQLSLKGHKVTVITPNPENDPKLVNLTEIDVSVGYKGREKYDLTFYSRQFMPAWMVSYKFRQYLTYCTYLEMESDGVQNLLKKNDSNFDLIIIEAHFPALYALQSKFKAPIAAISSLFISDFILSNMGNPSHSSFYPSPFYGFDTNIDFWERWDSFILDVGQNLINYFYLTPQADKFARKYFGDDIPYITEFIKNTSLLFLNINPLFSSKRPYVPTIIEISQIHVETESKELRKDLQDILDNAKKGAIYFSLGTNVRFGNIPQSFEDAVLKSLCELPFTVLLKWYKEDLPFKCKNVIVKKWYPQQSILAHPNIKSFVMQGGLQSLEEAIYYAIPMVVIPFLGDQPINAKKLMSFGLALQLNPVGIKQEELTSTILEVANNPRYKQKAVEAQKIFLDQPKSGLDQVLWWCEYVIRHKGAKHLRSPAADLPLYQYLLLDVIGATLAVILISIYIIYKLLTFVKTCFTGNKIKKE